jgi:hypothetical protein
LLAFFVPRASTSQSGLRSFCALQQRRTRPHLSNAGAAPGIKRRVVAFEQALETRQRAVNAR